MAGRPAVRGAEPGVAAAIDAQVGPLAGRELAA